MCICGYEMVRTCMTHRNFKLYVWNWYFRRYALLDGNDVCMMYDKVRMHILIVFTATWKLHTSKFGFCKVLKHICKYMSCSKICNSTVRARSSVTYCLCVMKYAHIVCNASCEYNRQYRRLLVLFFLVFSRIY